MADHDAVPRTAVTDTNPQRPRRWRALAIGVVVLALSVAVAVIVWGRFSSPGAAVISQRSDPQGALDCQSHPMLRRSAPDTLVTLSVPVVEGGELAVDNLEVEGSGASLTFGWAGGDVFHTAAFECYRVTVRVDGHVKSARGSFER